MSMFKNIGTAAFVNGGLKDTVTPASKPKEERSWVDNMYLQREGVVVAEDSDTYPKVPTRDGFW